MTIDPHAVLATLDLEQKVSLLAGVDAWHTGELPGVPAMRCSDGPAGVRGTSWSGPASASFPCSTALGATFDPALVEEVGQALGREAKSKGAHVLLAPTVNLHRTPIGGRNFECMSEDPTLTAQLAVAYVKGVQSERVAACIKHYIANDTEFERMTISSEVDERTLRELYLVPFEAAVRPVEHGGAGVRALMSSYNRINGTYAADHVPLLRGVLRDEWGYDGVVISDWFGLHSTVEGLEAGLDLEMPGPSIHRGAKLLEAVQRGEVDESRVDESVLRLLELFDWAEVGERASEEGTDDSEQTRDVIRRAAIAGTVLLKNELVGAAAALPIDDAKRIALIGPNSERGQIQGGGSARVRANRPVALLAALKARGADITHAQGCSIDKVLPPMRGSFTVTYRTPGAPEAVVEVSRLNLIWMDAPAPGIDRGSFGASITGTFTPETTGDWSLSLTSVGPAVLRLDGEVVVDLSTPQSGGAFFGVGSPEVRTTVGVEAGRSYQVDVEYPHLDFGQMRGLIVGAEGPRQGDAIADAAAIAEDADVAVVVVGTNADWETEGEDRTTMDLPGDQDELVRRVAAANPNTVVVINAGSPVTMPWLDDVAAVLQIWFPGEEIGNSVADVLLGVAEPGGRLPVTVPKRLADTPAYLSHPGQFGVASYDEGLYIGYRWYDARDIEPQFPFGHGLGYTTWSFGATSVSGSVAEGITVRVRVTNTGERSGSTVVQCYVAARESSPRRPLRELRGFAKVTLAANESRDVEIVLPERAFAVWSPVEHGWVVPAGAYEVLIGSSSRDLTGVGVVVAG